MNLFTAGITVTYLGIFCRAERFPGFVAFENKFARHGHYIASAKAFFKSTKERTKSIFESAKSKYYPTLTLNGSLGSGYSGLNQTASGFTSIDVPIGTTASGEQVSTTTQVPTGLEVKPFGDQLSDNFNQSIGLQLTIPIFNRFQINSGVSQAKLNAETRELNYEQTKNQVRQTIEQAYADAVAALKNYNSNVKAVKALRESYSYMEKRYDVGMLNVVDLTASKNRLTQAESNLLRAKYDFIFKQKILDFYQGKALAF